MTNICAALGLAQLEQVDTFLRRKREIAELYRKGLAGSKVVTHTESEGCTHSYWMCSILVGDPSDREPLRDHLALRGIETRPLFYPVHTMPMYATRFQRHVVAEDIGWRGINLPSWPGLKDADVAEICSAIRDYPQP
jgi:perosamine synthetase